VRRQSDADRRVNRCRRQLRGEDVSQCVTSLRGQAKLRTRERMAPR
jgi:hypothetical protein